MPHHTELISTIAVGLTAAVFFGVIAHRLKLPVLVGYLLAGVAVGPFTPGFVADPELAPQLAEMGVIFLMFGVGLHFSINDLLSVRKLALPGALAQVAVASSLGTLLGMAFGWSFGAAAIFGLSLSVASTVVILRALGERGALHSMAGRVTVGWLVVEDLIMVMALVLLPAIAGSTGNDSSSMSEIFMAIGWTLVKVGAFVAAMLVVGSRAIPYFLGIIDRTESRELFVVGVLTAGLGVAYGAAQVFDVSFALGAFLGGVVINGSIYNHRAEKESLPLQEVFSVLFFVSIGMVIDPKSLLDDVGIFILALAIVLVAKAGIALIIVRALGGKLSTGLVVAAGLSQIGEFSLILAEVGVGLDLLADGERNVILTVALASIALNPLLFALASRISKEPLFPTRTTARADLTAA